MKRYLVVLLLTITILGCGELWKLVPIDPGNKPVILDSYAPQNVKPGTVWKILVEAEDKDGDMKKIVAAIAPGPQSFLTYSFISIQEEEGEHLAGYIFVKTPRSPSLHGKMFHVTIFVQDKEGRKSKSVGFLLHFTEESEAESELPEKWQHPSTNKLGGIFSDYFVEYVRELTSPRE
jgi:hypothetical protein